MNDKPTDGTGDVLAQEVARCLRPGRRGGVPARFALELRPGQRPGPVAEAAQAYLSGTGVRTDPLSDLDDGVLVLEFPEHSLAPGDPAAAFSAGRALAAALDVEMAEPDLPTAFFPEQSVRQPTGRVIDESVTEFPPWCWAPEEPELNTRPRWALESMRVPEAWDFSRQEGRPAQGAEVIVAQPDTGMTRHAELRGVRALSGFDFVASDRDPTDPLRGTNPGHGTATASVLVSPSTLRVTGSAPEARHMPLRAIESVVLITQVTVARAVDWAVNHGASVISMSLGGIPSTSMQRALQRAVASDVIVLAAAGNCVGTVVWPARYDECIAVAGTNRADGQWRGSCRGAAVDISAPAQNVVRAWLPPGAASGGNHVGQGQGTSFAVALTAGVAAMWLAHHGRANLVAQARARGETLQTMFRRLVQATARRPRGWNSFEMGAGIVDANALLRASLDTGRDRETADYVPSPSHSEATAMASLVAETVGIDAVRTETLDWHRFGPELANALLSHRIAASDQPQTESPTAGSISDDLAEAIDNPRLKEWFGLQEPGAAQHNGTEPPQ